MCGIAGFCNRKNDSKEMIKCMTDAISYRGPDSYGFWEADNGDVVLGHRRLSIIDCSDRGAQPMRSHSGRFLLTYNGEIYNHKILREELVKEGISFRGNSDTETLVEAIDYFGVEVTLEKIKGMFAFALYDTGTRDLYLVRDRVGEKPLYYGFVNDKLTFASELSSFEAIPDNNLKIDSGAVELYFRRGFIPAPYSIYSGIYKLEPGHYIKSSYPYRDFQNNVYWSALEVALKCHEHPFKGDFYEATNELERILKEVIRGQMISDVPLGAFLSAGIDSSTVVSLMQEISDAPVRTFTVGITGSDYNEAPIAREIANILGTKHTEAYVSIPEIMKAIPTIADIYSEPHGDSSQIPTSIICKLARKDVTVMLSGDGGDELLCGYDRRYNWAISEFAKKKRYPEVIQNIRASIKGVSGQGRSVQARKLRANSLQGIYSAIFGWDTSFVNTDYIYKDLNDLSEVSGFSSFDALMYMDFMEYMPDDNLAKVDRAAMHYSLETRIPLLDKDVVEFLWTLPIDMKYSEGITKRVLRSVLYRHIPKELMERPKTGFSIPISEWLKTGELRNWAEDILKTSIDTEYLNKAKIMNIWENYLNHNMWTDSIWYVLMFCAWKEKQRVLV